MDNNISLKVYYNGQILLEAPQDVIFMCNNLCISVVSFVVLFEEIKSFIYQNIDLHMSQKVIIILYRQPILVSSGFVQFQAICIIDNASPQKMFSIYYQAQSQVSIIELYVEFE
ncbi:hypothetical protein AHAS_Ahas17G0149300 [Arachis hypogaea]